MSKRDPLVEFSKFSHQRILVDQSGVEQHNPHRFEMQLLDGILFECPQTATCVGFKDVTQEEFWVRGHMPGQPLMPGVIMAETAAQAISYFCIKFNLLESNLIGMGGIDQMRVRAPVSPGDRFVVMVQKMKIRPRLLINSCFQGWVNNTLAVDGFIKGVVLSS